MLVLEAAWRYISLISMSCHISGLPHGGLDSQRPSGSHMGSPGIGRTMLSSRSRTTMSAASPSQPPCHHPLGRAARPWLIGSHRPAPCVIGGIGLGHGLRPGRMIRQCLPPGGGPSGSGGDPENPVDPVRPGTPSPGAGSNDPSSSSSPSSPSSTSSLSSPLAGFAQRLSDVSCILREALESCLSMFWDR